MEIVTASMGLPGSSAVAGIDLGATLVRIAFAARDGRITSRAQTSMASLQSPDNVVEWVGRQVRRRGRPARLGIGAPGLIDSQRRVLVHPPNLGGWRQVQLASMLEETVGCPVHLENDANLAALAEYQRGAGRGCRNLVYITWSTGVGGGLILDGQLYVGSRGLAGEIGHIVIDPEGPPCSCGQRGCLEALSGGASIERQTGLSAQRLFERAAEGDQDAVAVFRRAASAMGRVLVTLTHLFDPDVIAIGGGVATNSWRMVQPILNDVLQGSPFIDPSRRPALRRARLGQSTGQVGAVEWARINLEDAA